MTVRATNVTGSHPRNADKCSSTIYNLASLQGKVQSVRRFLNKQITRNEH